MHPIEHLRYLARTDSIDGATLVGEAAVALGSLRPDPAQLVLACRRILARHPTVGPLWWLCASLLTAPDGAAAAWGLADRLAGDELTDQLGEALAAAGTDTVHTAGWPATLGVALLNRLDDDPDDDATVSVVVAGDGAEPAGFARRIGRFGVPIGFAGDPARRPLTVVEARAAGSGRILVDAEVADAVDAAHTVGRPAWCVIPVGGRLPERYLDAIVRVGGADLVSLDPGRFARIVSGTEPAAPFAPELLRAVTG